MTGSYALQSLTRAGLYADFFNDTGGKCTCWRCVDHCAPFDVLLRRVDTGEDEIVRICESPQEKE